MTNYKEITDSEQFGYDERGYSKYGYILKNEIFKNDYVMSKLGKGNIKRGKKIMKQLLERNFYWASELERIELEALIMYGYTTSNSKNKKLMVKDENGRFEYVVCDFPKNETLQHVRDKEFIASLDRNISYTEWKVPDSMERIDVVLRKYNFSIGVEIQISVLEYRRLMHKIDVLLDYCDRWFMIMPKKFVAKYSYLNNKFGKVTTMRNAIEEITELLRKIPKEPNKA